LLDFRKAGEENSFNFEPAFTDKLVLHRIKGLSEKGEASSSSEGGQRMIIRDSPRFADLGSIPLIEEDTPLRKVYATLYGKGVSRFIVVEKRGHPRFYVQGAELARILAAHAEGKVQEWESIASAPVGRLSASLGRPCAVMPVLDAPLDARSPEPSQSEQREGVAAVESFGVRIGWLLTSALEASTEKTVFVCKNGHRNPDPDNGTCCICPAVIDHVETTS
jgi:hypothetical protein